MFTETKSSQCISVSSEVFMILLELVKVTNLIKICNLFFFPQKFSVLCITYISPHSISIGGGNAL